MCIRDRAHAEGHDAHHSGVPQDVHHATPGGRAVVDKQIGDEDRQCDEDKAVTVSYTHLVGKKIVDGEMTLESLADYAEGLKSFDVPSGRQEYLHREPQVLRDWEKRQSENLHSQHLVRERE